jgi:hypothetical protein
MGAIEVPAPWPMTATLEWAPTTEWENWHHTVRQKIAGIYIPHYPVGSPTTTPAILNGCTKDIQIAIRAAKDRGLRLRAAGSAWSLSRAGVTDGVMLDTSRLKGWVKISEGNLDPGYKGDAERRPGLYMFQCGTLVAEVNKLLESDQQQRSLWTSGAANGQTIVGATSTGTHGSALGFGALHDHIVAIHLLAGPDKSYLLERETYPVLKPAFADLLGATPLRSDNLFNAAMLSFGSFGVIHNVVIETSPRFLLKAETHAPVPFDGDLRALIATLDPDAHPKLASKGKPYFLQIVINPHSKDAMINAMYRLDWKPGYVPDYGLKEGKVGPGYDGLGLVGEILKLFPGLIPSFFKLAQGTVDTKAKVGTRGELFSYKAPQTKVGSGSIAVALADALKTLDLLTGLIKKHPAPLVFGCRFVRKSPALLAFNRFDKMTMVVSLDGVFNDQTADFFDLAAKAMEQAKIPYTQHWGKVNAYTGPRLKAAYGDDFDAWLAARKKLLPDPADRAVFTNAYMEERGLAG